MKTKQQIESMLNRLKELNKISLGPDDAIEYGAIMALEYVLTNGLDDLTLQVETWEQSR